MTHNLDDLAKLAPFHASDRYVYPTDEFTVGDAGDSICLMGSGDECRAIAAALNEWAELRAYRERTEALVKAAGELWACLQSSKDCGEIFVPKRLAVFMHRFAAALDAGDPAPKEATDGE
jgi:hypothetical protein